MLRRILPAACILALARIASAGMLLNGPGLDPGYRQMYNLDFEGAHETFRQWSRQRPEDPLGPISDAAAYLYSELDRLHVLQSELFVDDEKFEHREKLTADSRVRRAFQEELAQGDRL
ncbi:MAG TPA: hypothetical protein VEU62_23540, partial [Bryobacterales bacterium]|nr:hypothetical protein [Bryobacterales bacterium]